MKIKVKYSASASEKFDTWDMDDLGVTIDQWNGMTEDERNQVLMAAAESEQPYWAVDKYEEWK